jgi:winged helix DNA-binding protein
MRSWSGLALRPAFEGLRPRLKTYRDESGVELFDLPRAPRPDRDLEVPPRLIPDFDNILLAHADRSRIMPPGKHLGIFSSNGVMQGAVLLDGFVRAMWAPRGNTLVITPFGKPLTKAEQRSTSDEAMRLMQLLAPGERHDLGFAPARA